ncbi:restriction endonuclease subunit S [Moorena bouillonii]|uniref:Type I restriction modification DNA specificity domain-containing protein n=1 Tax=Moorena bouillonii PNG TaxID=568701 RepID=A0A1U7N2R7_9CYAN|nr:restriction endonuclease subunit S [Moorena bouillonii]OLT60240.1 hypothetical protein BJP37_15615 [Moorena bouillonii PNG]
MKYLFPSSWSICPFHKVANVVTGTTPSTQHPEYYGGSIPFVGPTELGKTEPINRSAKWLSSLGASKARILPAESTLICCIGATIGKVGFSGTELATNQQINALVPDKNILYPRYVFYYCRTLEKLIRHMGASTTLPLLPKGQFKNIEIPFPPLEEQKRIAAILDKADSIRRKRKEAIALTEELLRSTFLDMFGDPVTNPKGWEIVKLGSQIEELKYGTNSKCSNIQRKEDIPVLRIPNIVGDKLSWDELKYTKLESKEISKLILKKDDLLFVRSNGNPEYIGRCALVEANGKQAVYASYLIRARIKPDAQLYPGFIRDIISFPSFRYRLVIEARTTAGNYNINIQGLSRLKLICPPMDKQKRYLTLKKTISDHIIKEQNHLENSDNLFKSLLQKAFRGEL